MKVLFVLTAALLLSSGAQANFFKDLGSLFKNAASSLVKQLDTLGGSLLKAATSSGLTLLTQGTQALVLNTANAFTATKTPERRDVSALLGKVDSFKNEAVDLLKLGEEQLKGVLSNVVAEFNKVVDKVANFEITPESVIRIVDGIVGDHLKLFDTFVPELVKTVESLVSKHFSLVKRNVVTDLFGGLQHQLSSLFAPILQGVKNLISSAGAGLKDTATNFLNSAKSAAGQLVVKLAPHLLNLQQQANNLVQQGTSALNSVKGAVSAVVQQVG